MSLISWLDCSINVFKSPWILSKPCCSGNTEISAQRTDLAEGDLAEFMEEHSDAEGGKTDEFGVGGNVVWRPWFSLSYSSKLGMMRLAASAVSEEYSLA